MNVLRILAAFVVLAAGTFTAGAQQLCNGSFEDFALYIYEPNGRCWTNVKNLGVAEGTVSLAKDFAGASRYRARLTASFLVAFERRPDYESGLVVKERVYYPNAISADETKKLRDPAPTPIVSLERPAIANRCGIRSALRSEASVDLNIYNRYHLQTYGFIPLSGELRQFHYKYPRPDKPCQDTQDLASRNRSQFAFSDLVAEPNSFLTAMPSFISSARADNKVYRRLKARNLVLKAGNPDQENPRFALVQFQTNGQAYTRSEFTITDLEYRDSFQQHWPQTWQIEWIP